MIHRLDLPGFGCYYKVVSNFTYVLLLLYRREPGQAWPKIICSSRFAWRKANVFQQHWESSGSFSQTFTGRECCLQGLFLEMRGSSGALRSAGGSVFGCWGGHSGGAEASVQERGGKPAEKKLLPIIPSISNHLVSQARDVPSTLQSRLRNTRRLTRPGARGSNSATRTELLPPTDHPGISQCLVQHWDQDLVLFWGLSLPAFEPLLLRRRWRVLRTDTIDVAKRDVARIFGKMTQIFMMQTVA